MDETMTVDELLAAAPFAALRLDAQGAVVACNDRATALLGVSDIDLGRSIAEVCPIGEPGGWPRLLVEGRAGRRRWRTRGCVCEWRTQSLRDGGALCYAVEVPAREELERTALRAILDNVSIAVWVVGADGRYLYHEGCGLAKVGLRPGQMVGASVFEVFAGNPALEVLRRGLAGETARYPATTPGAVEWDTWQVPVRGGDGDVEALVGISLEITELKQATHELQAKLDLIERQQRAIREMLTPIIEVWDRVLTLPLVGLVDSVRTAEIMENLLQAVVRTRARFAVLDLTGVDVVDTGTASHVLGLIRAIRLLGAEGILTGIHPGIAHTIVSLGIDLRGLEVRASLREALEHCITRLQDRRRS
jgi:rsbT co-antagonist protein RsbR